MKTNSNEVWSLRTSAYDYNRINTEIDNTDQLGYVFDPGAIPPGSINRRLSLVKNSTDQAQ